MPSIFNSTHWSLCLFGLKRALHDRCWTGKLPPAHHTVHVLALENNRSYSASNWFKLLIGLICLKPLKDLKDLDFRTIEITQSWWSIRGSHALNDQDFILFHPPESIIRVFKVNTRSKEGTTVFLRARTRPSGEPKRKKSDTSKSNFPRAPPPSSMVLLLDRREPGSFLKTLECRLHIHTIYTIICITASFTLLQQRYGNV